MKEETKKLILDFRLAFYTYHVYANPHLTDQEIEDLWDTKVQNILNGYVNSNWKTPTAMVEYYTDFYDNLAKAYEALKIRRYEIPEDERRPGGRYLP